VATVQQIPIERSGEQTGKSLEEEVVRWCDDVYNEADQELAESHETKVTARIIDFLEGKQWSSKARYGRSRPVINRIFRHFVETVGLLTDLELDFTVRFTDKGVDGFSEIERLINQMIPDWAFENDFEDDLSQVVMWGLLNSGPVKVQWNPFLNDGWGDVEMLSLSPLNFLTIGATTNLEKEAEVCIYRHAVTMPELLRRHGDVAKGVKPEAKFSEMPGETIRPARFTKARWQVLNPQLKKLMGKQSDNIQSQYPRTLRKEFWLRDDSVWDGKESIIVGQKVINGVKIAPSWAYRVEPGMKLFPRGRVIVIAGGKVLEDSPNPYWHGRIFPFAIYHPFRVPWKFPAGLSPMEPIAAMQAILNRINGGVMDTVNAAIEPSIMGPKSAFSQQDWDTIDPGQPGAKFAYNNNTPRPPEWRPAPDLKAYVLETKHDIEREMDMTSGSSAISQAVQKKQVPGGDALEMIFNSRSTNIRFMGRSLKTFLTQVGGMVTADMLQFYDARRRILKYGEGGIVANDCVPMYRNVIPKGMEPEEFVRKVNFSIRKGSVLNIEKQEKIPVAFAMRKQGDLSRRGLWRFLDVNIDLDRNDAELKKEQAEKLAMGAAVAAASGKGHKK